MAELVSAEGGRGADGRRGLQHAQGPGQLGADPGCRTKVVSHFQRGGIRQFCAG